MTEKNIRQQLLGWQNPYDHEGTSSLFMENIRKNIAHHIERNEFFRKLMERSGLSPEDIRTEADLAKIPMIPANFFKYYESLSVPREDVVVHITSSGTSGQKSQMFFDEDSWDFGQQMIKNLFGYAGFLSDETVNYLLYTYEPTEGSELGTAKTDEGMLQYAPVGEVFFALRYNGVGHDFDVYGAIEALQRFEKDGKPVRIFGFPSFMYFTLQQMKDLGYAPLKLNKNSMTLFGGGWKGYADKQVSKPELYALITEMLGIPDENIRDGYGSTEHSVPYFECKRHRFHVPVYSRVIIRDLKTLKPLPFGKPGFASFVTPHLTSVPGVSVLMTDLAVLRPGEECGCGIKAPFMEILGRAGTSAVKSCAVTASELLKR